MRAPAARIPAHLRPSSAGVRESVVHFSWGNSMRFAPSTSENLDLMLSAMNS
jgi:hypothetical protein